MLIQLFKQVNNLAIKSIPLYILSCLLKAKLLMPFLKITPFKLFKNLFRNNGNIYKIHLFHILMMNFINNLKLNFNIIVIQSFSLSFVSAFTIPLLSKLTNYMKNRRKINKCNLFIYIPINLNRYVSQ